MIVLGGMDMAENEERDIVEEVDETEIEDGDFSQNTRERIVVERGKRSYNLLEKFKTGREVWAIVFGIFSLLIVYLTYRMEEGFFVRGETSISSPVIAPRTATIVFSIILLVGYFLLILGCSTFLLKRIGILLVPLSRYVWNRSFITLSIAFSNIDRNILVRRSGVVLLILMTFTTIFIPMPANRFSDAKEQELYRSGGDIAITVIEDDPLFTNDTINGLQIRDLSEGLLNGTLLQSITDLSYIKSVGGFTQTVLQIENVGLNARNIQTTIIIFTPVSTNFTYSYWKESYGDVGSLYPTSQNSVNVYSPAEKHLDIIDYRFKSGENLSLGTILAPNKDHGANVEYKIENSFNYLPGALYLSKGNQGEDDEYKTLEVGYDEDQYFLLTKASEFFFANDAPIVVTASMETRDLIVEDVLNLTNYQLQSEDFSIKYLLEIEESKEEWRPALDQVLNFSRNITDQGILNGTITVSTPWIAIEEVEGWIGRSNLSLWILVGFNTGALLILQALYLFNFYKDRRNEIGTYKSSGIGNRQILRIIFLESFTLQIIALIGALAGFYLSRTAYIIFNTDSYEDSLDILVPLSYEFPMRLFLIFLLPYYLIIIISNYLVLKSIGRKKIAELLG